ncbi:unnamed protein product [Adineta steineri]|uniref:Uncharacterized protein n=1 Tax=Adineta steineri TaxID=433720 RepID=A0A819Q704_9BILA|nr:unnamed protein product [Adineta steineri]CAF0744366.1 unnamed protein product [Adineta steineri]CAF0759604.1 unnamed protein product [Adineta steineri]CAF1364801.1 unnamed protein product [Adineta steineri]CAF1601627.1 unnamed protein product [Adineta steineri]
MDVDSNILSDSNWKSGVCWGNLAGCLAFYHSLVGFILLTVNVTFIFLTSDYLYLFGSLIALGFIIILLGIILLPLVFTCILGRQYHIYATSHAYITFVVNLINIFLIILVAYEVNQLKIFSLLSTRFLIADLALLVLSLIVGIIAWITYVGRQFHEPNGQFILQL